MSLVKDTKKSIILPSGYHSFSDLLVEKKPEITISGLKWIIEKTWFSTRNLGKPGTKVYRKDGEYLANPYGEYIKISDKNHLL